jgi:peptide/nickel transport system permease protein
LRPAAGMARLAWREMTSRWGARLGLTWIAVLVFGAVLAPFLANTHPLLMKAQGRWSSPLLSHLTRVDVILMVLALTGGVLFAWRRSPWRRKALIWAGVAVVAVPLTLVLVRPPLLVVYDQYRKDARAGNITYALYAPIPYSPQDRQRDVNNAEFKNPDRRHWLGTERDGADLLSQLIHASRVALAVGFIATGIALVIGVAIGGLMGYFAGTIDILGMRLVEIFSSIPTLFLLIACVAFVGRNLYFMMVIIGLTGWVGYARFVRAEFLKLRQQDFVVAARACGLPLRSILFRHMLPNGMAPVLVSASFGVASAILTESTLSFLGLGLVDEASWGTLLNQALGSAGNFRWWITVFPGLAIFLTVFAYNLIGEALRDAIDPHSKRVSQL